MSSRRISVALATLNGEKYLLAQLRSFCSQSLCPDELVICDDQSTDSTIAIIREFSVGAPFVVRVFENEVRLGYAKNFEKAIRICEGEIILLSDQDDVWMPEKVGKMADAFRADPSIAFVVCNADVVGEKLQPLGLTLWKKEGFELRDATELRTDHKYAKMVQTRFAHGNCLAIRGRLKDEMFPIPDNWAHDAWIVLFLGALYKCKYMPECLNVYRQHASQTTGSRYSFTERVMQRLRRPPPDQYLSRMEERFRVLEAAVARRPSDQASITLPVIKGAQMHYGVRAVGRASLLARVPCCVRELLSGRYHRFSKGIFSFIDDLLARRTAAIKQLS